MIWLRSDGFSFQICVEVGLCFCWWDVSDRFEQTAVVEPVRPFEGRVFHGHEAALAANKRSNNAEITVGMLGYPGLRQ